MTKTSPHPKYLADQRRLRRRKWWTWSVSVVAAIGIFAAANSLADIPALGLLALGGCLAYVVAIIAGTLLASQARYTPDGHLISEATEERSKDNAMSLMAYGAKYREYGEHDYHTYRPEEGRPHVDPAKTADRIKQLTDELRDLDE